MRQRGVSQPCRAKSRSNRTTNEEEGAIESERKASVPLTASALRYRIKSDMRYNAVHDVEQQIGAGSCVVRATHARKGRTMWLEPGRSPMTQLHYGRIIL